MCGSGCVPVALQLLVWGVFIYDHVRWFVELCFEQNLPSTLPKKAQLGCESTIAICGMNATCGIFIRMCAIFSKILMSCDVFCVDAQALSIVPRFTSLFE